MWSVSLTVWWVSARIDPVSIIIKALMIKYITFTGELFRDKRLSPGEKFLLAILIILTRKGKQNTTASDGFLANELAMTSQHANRMIANLAKMNIISLKREFGRRVISLESKVIITAGFMRASKTTN